ncbi:MAG: DUF4836 family protein [Bacteroidales bacterium]|nr:DUF4836 family protein [Bacteroidales bacterium]
MKAIVRHSTLLLASVMLMVLSACHHEEKSLLETIPADAGIVSIVNLNKWVDQCGDALSAIADPEFTTYYGQAKEAIDLDHLVIFLTGNTYVLTAKVTDLSKLNALLKQARDAEVTTQEGYYRCSGTPLVWNDHQVWSIVGPNPLEHVKTILQSAEKQNFTSNYGAAEYLEVDHLTTLALNQSIIGQMGLANVAEGEKEPVFSCFDVDVKSNAIAVHGTNMKADGTLVAYTGFKEINTDFLRYVPDYFLGAAAAGIDKANFNWEPLAAVVSMMGGLQAQGMVQTFLPFLQSIDGTVAIAGGPKDLAQIDDLSTWDWLAMVHMPQEMVDNGVATLTRYLGGYGFNITTDREGHFTASWRDKTFYGGAYDGYFTVSNAPIESTHNNQLNTTFLSKEAAAYLLFPTLEWVNPSATFGAKITFGMETESMSMQINLEDTNEPIVPTLIRLFGGFI